MQNETEESIQEQWRESATKDLERSLVLQQFIREERLRIGDNELESALDERMAQFGDVDDEMKQTLRQIMLGQDGVQTLANDIMMDKIYDRFMAIAAGEAPDLDALEAAEAEAEAAEEADDVAEEATEAEEVEVVAEVEETAADEVDESEAEVAAAAETESDEEEA